MSNFKRCDWCSTEKNVMGPGMLLKLERPLKDKSLKKLKCHIEIGVIEAQGPTLAPTLHICMICFTAEMSRLFEELTRKPLPDPLGYPI